MFSNSETLVGLIIVLFYIITVCGLVRHAVTKLGSLRNEDAEDV